MGSQYTRTSWRQTSLHGPWKVGLRQSSSRAATGGAPVVGTETGSETVLGMEPVLGVLSLDNSSAHSHKVNIKKAMHATNLQWYIFIDELDPRYSMHVEMLKFGVLTSHGIARDLGGSSPVPFSPSPVPPAAGLALRAISKRVPVLSCKIISQ